MLIIVLFQVLQKFPTLFKINTQVLLIGLWNSASSTSMLWGHPCLSLHWSLSSNTGLLTSWGLQEAPLRLLRLSLVMLHKIACSHPTHLTLIGQQALSLQYLHDFAGRSLYWFTACALPQPASLACELPSDNNFVLIGYYLLTQHKAASQLLSE